MNKARRNRIAIIRAKLESLHDELEAIKEEENEYFEAMPESIQSGMKGQKAEEAAQLLEDACTAITEATEAIDSIE